MPISTDETPTPETDPNKKRNDELLSGIEACKAYRRKLTPNWSLNIDRRRGKTFASQSDEDRISVPLDWSMTKTKQTALFSQLPQVRINHPQAQGEWVQTYQQKINDILATTGIDVAMDECLPDCINASGFGVILVSHESITENVDIPTQDPNLPAEDGSDSSPQTVPRVVDHKYGTNRISPSDFLWPIDFTGSNFDNCGWLGRSGRVSWAEGVRLFGLTEADKEVVLGEDRNTLDRLTFDLDKDRSQPEEKVSFDEIWYKDHQYDPEAKSFSTLHHLVFVGGKKKPIINKPWEGQKIDPQTGTVLGATKFPIRVLTLAYITDEAIPPSDSAMGRPQVDEINESRTQMILQRKRNLPVRWIDVNRVDPAVQMSLMRGTWQNFIPVQGAGDHIIGEVAKAGHPQEDFTIDQIAKNDFSETCGVGPNQTGSGKGIETAEESQNVEGSFQNRLTYERARVGKFFSGIAEVLGGLVCLYEDPSTLGKDFNAAISRGLVYSIVADSTVIVDTQQRIQRLIQFVNFTAKSGYLNVEPVLKEIATLSGLDPNLVIQKPQPTPPAEPSISLRLTGAEDMMNPLTLAFMLKAGQAPSADLIEQAKAMIQAALSQPAPPQPEQPPPSGPTSLTGDGPPPPPAPPVGDANPQWEGMSRVNKRMDDSGGGGA